MEYASVSVKFPVELDAEIERFLDDTGLYTNKSEFIKEACRTHLRELNDDTMVAAVRLEQSLRQAEAATSSPESIEAELATLADTIESNDLERAVAKARDETETQVFESEP